VPGSYACDPAESVAQVAAGKRGVLLRAYRGWLRAEDLEDCYSQATLELLTRARREGAFKSVTHIGNALEQKLRSRIHDRRRALSGRSAAEAAIASALPLGEPEDGCIDVPDPRASTLETVSARLHLRRVLTLAKTLSYDQRLVLVSQLQLDLDARELSRRLGWSEEKYRKVAQRGRARLRLLIEDEQAHGDVRTPGGRADVQRRPHGHLVEPASERAPGPTYETQFSRS
jgi:DNA-directed RNA polymerase specialized sigma24 family protein